MLLATQPPTFDGISILHKYDYHLSAGCRRAMAVRISILHKYDYHRLAVRIKNILHKFQFYISTIIIAYRASTYA